MLGVKANFSTVDQLQIDRQTEIMNQYQENCSELLLLLDISQLIMLYFPIRMASFKLCNGFELLIS